VHTVQNLVGNILNPKLLSYGEQTNATCTVANCQYKTRLFMYVIQYWSQSEPHFSERPLDKC